MNNNPHTAGHVRILYALITEVAERNILADYLAKGMLKAAKAEEDPRKAEMLTAYARAVRAAQRHLEEALSSLQEAEIYAHMPLN